MHDKWDVIAGAMIRIEQKARRPYIWSANLWYTNLGQGSAYRWWEVLYMTHPLVRTQRNYEPFALDIDELSQADAAGSHIMTTIQFAAKPRPIDDEDLDSFCERWIDLLAKAYKGEITHPTYLPLDR